MRNRRSDQPGVIENSAKNNNNLKFSCNFSMRTNLLFELVNELFFLVSPCRSRYQRAWCHHRSFVNKNETILDRSAPFGLVCLSPPHLWRWTLLEDQQIVHSIQSSTAIEVHWPLAWSHLPSVHGWSIWSHSRAETLWYDFKAISFF